MSSAPPTKLAYSTPERNEKKSLNEEMQMNKEMYRFT